MKINDKPGEECAVFGVSLTADEAAETVYQGLVALQHRGQEGAGMAVISDHKILYHKNVGLVSEVFSEKVLAKLPKSKTAVGHNRYSTTGNNRRENVQPFITEYLTGRIAVAHNGNVINAKEIKEELQEKGLKFTSTSDSEVVSALIAYHIMKTGDTLTGIREGVSRLCGSFSLIILTGEGKLCAVRDASGYRPLCIGKSEDGIAFASESCALDSCGFDFVRDVKPGEIVVVEEAKITFEKVELEKREKNGLCIFEYVYFSRPDSVIDGLSVYEARMNMGRILSREYPIEADVVCGVPDSGLEAAMGYSAESGIPYALGFVKNRYVGRSFICPTQSQREKAVRLKLNPLSVNIKDKRIVLVDDSIVRGTTMKRIVAGLKKAGAKEVHLRISSPPFCHTCLYGTDIGSEENLIANQITSEELCREIGADSLGYISIKGLEEACKKCTLSFCNSCFSGNDAHKAAKKNALA